MLRTLFITSTLVWLAGCDLGEKIISSQAIADPELVNQEFTKAFGAAVPEGYQGAFDLSVSVFGGMQKAQAIALIPDDADAASIFEGGQSVKFNPGRHTIALAYASSRREKPDQVRSNIQRLLWADGSTAQAKEVFVDIGHRKIAVYEQRSVSYGQSNLGYYLFLDDGEMIYIVGSEAGFDRDFLRALATNISDAHPANELLYVHVGPAQPDADHPCGISRLPEEFDVHVISVPRGNTELSGVAIDPEKDVVFSQTVVVGRTQRPAVLVLMAAQPVVWEVKTSEDAQLAGIVAGGNTVQRVLGLNKSVELNEADPDLKNGCGRLYASDSDDSDYRQVDAKLWAAFGRGVSQFQTTHSGESFSVGEPTDTAEARGSRELADVVLDPVEQVLPGKLGIAQLMADGKLRPAGFADLKAWYESGAHDPELTWEKVRRSADVNVRMERVYQITAATDLPPGMYGAHSAYFIVDSGVAEPTGDLGHNTIFYHGGRCRGSCPR